MAALARRVSKTLLFITLFLLFARYIYTPLSFASAWNEHYVFVVTDFLGVRDVDLFDMLVGIVASLIFATLTYIALLRLYRHRRMTR